MSTDLFAYLNYMSGWTGGPDENIQSLIDEHNYFVSLGNYAGLKIALNIGTVMFRYDTSRSSG